MEMSRVDGVEGVRVDGVSRHPDAIAATRRRRESNQKGRGRARLAAPPEVVVLEDLHLRAADGRAGLARDLPEVVHVEHAAEGAPVAVAEVLGADLGGEALRVREDDAPAARVPLAERLIGPAAHEVPEGLDEPAL